MYQCNFHEVKSLKGFLPLEKIVPDREQQQKLHLLRHSWLNQSGWNYPFYKLEFVSQFA